MPEGVHEEAALGQALPSELAPPAAQSDGFEEGELIAPSLWRLPGRERTPPVPTVGQRSCAEANAPRRSDPFSVFVGTLGFV